MVIFDECKVCRKSSSTNAKYAESHLRQMQSMQKAVQLTTFCVKSKEKYKCIVSFKKNAIVYVIYVL